MASYPKAVVAAQSIIDNNTYLDEANSYCVCVTAPDLATLMEAVNVLVDGGWYVNGGITIGPRAPESFLIVLSYEEEEE